MIKKQPQPPPNRDNFKSRITNQWIIAEGLTPEQAEEKFENLMAAKTTYRSQTIDLRNPPETKHKEIPTNFKFCPDCCETLCVSKFSKVSKSPDGLQYVCRRCFLKKYK